MKQRKLIKMATANLKAENDDWRVQKLTEQLQAERERKCERCGDMFYHPKTVIADFKQHAAEWEDVAKRAEKERDSLLAEVERMRNTSAYLQAAHHMLKEAERLNGERDSLKAEVERLKQSLEIYEAEYGNPPHKPSNYVLKLANSELQMQNRKYKAALERIASLAERQALQGTLDGFAAKEMEIIAREALKETK